VSGRNNPPTGPERNFPPLAWTSDRIDDGPHLVADTGLQIDLDAAGHVARWATPGGYFVKVDANLDAIVSQHGREQVVNLLVEAGAGRFLRKTDKGLARYLVFHQDLLRPDLFRALGEESSKRLRQSVKGKKPSGRASSSPT